MAEKVKVNQPILLRLQLADEDSTAFPQAELVDQAGASVGSSPLNLSHIGSGLYVNDSELMPALSVVYAQYKVYSDAGYTQRHLVHCDTLLDVFERDLVAEAVDSIDTGLQGFSGNLDFLTGTIEGDEGELSGSVDDNGYLSGKIENDVYLTGVIEENLLIGHLHDEGQLTGVIDC